MLSELKPQSKQLVYDLVTEAGIDTSDWANYKRSESPASNPKYCYEWAFEGIDRVVLCLWHSEMHQSGSDIFQERNYRTASTEHRHWSANQKERSWRVDHAIRKAFIGKLPVRVIIVDGSRRGDEEKGASKVERRMLDPVEWIVSIYEDDTGVCRLERLNPPEKRTFLLTWSNFEETADSETEDIVKKLERAEPVEGRWSSGNRKDVNLGERVFLLRQGIDTPGLVGWGTISKEPFEGEHWDPVRRRAGVMANYIMIHWREMVPKDAGVPRARLVTLGIPEALLNAQGSGVIITEDISRKLETVWSENYRIFKKSLHLPGSNSLELESHSAYKLARIAYNSTGWQRPSGDARELESVETYNAKNKFGHEDWLFRAEWVIDGWRYAFIQGLNKHRLAYVGQPLDVTLYTLQPDKRRRLVATINGLESLDDDQAKDALEAFKVRGWLRTMQSEVENIGGNADALGDSKWAEHVLNVRYRIENVDVYSPDIFLSDDDWIHDRHRYMLYKLDPADRDRIEKSLPTRSGSQDAPSVRKLFRRGTNPVEYTPEHDKMQAKLMAELQIEFGRESVRREREFVDVLVETDKELVYFEIKTDLAPRAVIRQALGQILEYAYYPVRDGRRPDRLVIVGRTALGAEDTAYLGRLCADFKLPLSYRVVTI